MEFLASVLGFATFLLMYLWIFMLFGFHKWWQNYKWYWDMPKEKRSNWAALATAVGGLLIWAIWSFVLPDWWKAATPMVGYE